jgi:chemotaxis protein MotB
MQKQKEKSGGKAQAPVIIKKIKKGHGGHHGGAWKVAYADFVTAMMALFLLLWILSSTDAKTKAELARYFRDPGVFETSTGGGGNNPVAQFFGESGVLDKNHGILPENPLQGLQERIKEELSHLKEYAAIQEQISIQAVAEGLLIELVDREGDKTKQPFFDLSSAELKPALLHVVEKIVQQASALPNKIAIGGHTDARPFRNNGFYSNWELSAARALNTRRAMEDMGLPAGRIERVVGYADSALLIPSDPFAPANRRISILVLHNTTQNVTPTQVTTNSQAAVPGSPRL